MSIPRALAVASISLATILACSSNRSGFEENGGGGGNNNASPSDDGGTLFNTDADLGDPGSKPGTSGDPETCADAAQAKSYVGCEYWPTVTANPVQDVFDFAVAIANVGKQAANVTVTGNGANEQVTVAPGTLQKVYLPWQTELKGGADGLTASVVAKGGAFHLVSDRPVVVYQFNAFEFRAAGGKPGKGWQSCQKAPGAPDCYSYSNDASLLLPTTAMTGAYRIMGSQGFSRHPVNFLGQLDKSKPAQDLMGTFFTVTGTQNGTSVTVKLGAKAQVVAGGGISAQSPGSTMTFTLDAGDVAEITAPKGQGYDFSGSLLLSNKPVQVITGVPCMDFPFDTQACDHVEETVFPAETLGKHYVVLSPTGPRSNKVSQVVHFYGNADGTNLTYLPSKPAGCPATLNAGEVVDCGEVGADFEVTGDKEFGVGTFQLGGEKADPNFNPVSGQQPVGDPSQSFAVTVEQYRKRYIFLAPTDYTTSFVDVIAEPGTTLTLDGKDVSSQLSPITGTGYHKARIQLDAGKDGTHELLASKPAGIQVIGYGDNTSYQYPGGLNLGQIATVPPK
jgi:hypothetical protein